MKRKSVDAVENALVEVMLFGSGRDRLRATEQLCQLGNPLGILSRHLGVQTKPEEVQQQHLCLQGAAYRRLLTLIDHRDEELSEDEWAYIHRIQAVSTG